MKRYIKVIVSFSLLLIFFISSAAAIQITSGNSISTPLFYKDDFDPLTDIEVTVEINQIRSLEKRDKRVLPIDKIDLISDPDFYVKVIINDEEFTSPVYENMKYVYDPQWSATLNVPDDEEIVNITIQLWDSNQPNDRLCDISDNIGDYYEGLDVDLWYSIKSGHWFGDDYIFHDGWGDPDPSGYGRLNGCDDNSIYQNNRDCELWFNVYQNDFDMDGIPYWTEVNVFDTDPEIDDTGLDTDNDSIPIEWENKWGHNFRRNHWNGSYEHEWIYDPFIWDDHENIDEDNDGLNNVEEYLTSQWGSDPFRRDLFIELDQMEAGPNGEPASLLPEGSKELLQTAHDKQNIVYHLDDGSWEGSGSDMIPFDNETEMSWGGGTDELDQIYIDYFLHGDQDNWRRGVFHYGVIIYQCSLVNGNAFGNNRFQISSKGLTEKARSLPLRSKALVFASAYMHETGHTLNIYNQGVDNENSALPWHFDWWKFRAYKSVMNYGYMYQMVDYSDGSRGLNDFDDWQDLDLTSFDREQW